MWSKFLDHFFLFLLLAIPINESFIDNNNIFEFVVFFGGFL